MHRIAFATASILASTISSPALANGEVVITQAKALAGNVTPGDTPGFPVHLTRAGAYVLESNLDVPAGLIGINVTAHNVDIDLNGFTISGGGVATNGIKSNFGESRIHGGVINLFQGAGILLRNNAWVIENMQIVRNGGMGVDASEMRFITVRNSLVAANTDNGVRTGINGIINNNSISVNGGDGIVCTGRCQVTENIIDENQGDGIFISSGFVSDNTISFNKGYGIFDNTGSSDTGKSNNMLIGNNSAGTKQTASTIDVHPNACVGVPC